MPFQGNFDFNGGPNGNGRVWTTNIQPVIPITLNPQWNLIVRTTLPVIYRDNITDGREFGLGGRYYAIKPEGGPDWGLRAQLTFLFPK